MKAIKLKNTSDGFRHLENAVRDLGSVLQSHTPRNLGYSFYRGVLYSTDTLYVVGLKLLCSDINGNFSVQNIEYNLKERCLYYPPKMVLFENEEDVKEALEAFIGELEYMPYEVSYMYFDFLSEDVKYTALAACYMVKDAHEAGSVIAFASAGKDFHYKYNLSEAKKLCTGTALSVDWRSSIYAMLAEVSQGIYEPEKAKKLLETLGIGWVD